MDPKALAEIDRQIAQLKKELNTLFTKRIAILQDEIKRSEAEAHALSVGSPGSPSPQAKAKRSRLAKPLAEDVAAPPPERPARQRDTGTPTAPPPAEKPLPPEPEAPARSDAPQGETEAQIWNALKEAALFGLSQAEISKLTGLRSALVGSKLKDLPGVTKKGAGRDARYYLKS